MDGLGITLNITNGEMMIPLNVVKPCSKAVLPRRALNMSGSPHAAIGYPHV
jgi:hypothetical protein